MTRPMLGILLCFCRVIGTVDGIKGPAKLGQSERGSDYQLTGRSTRSERTTPNLTQTLPLGSPRRSCRRFRASFLPAARAEPPHLDHVATPVVPCITDQLLGPAPMMRKQLGLA